MAASALGLVAIAGALAHPGGNRERPGLHGGIAGRPVVLALGHDGVEVHPVATRDPATIPAARRPRFEVAPRWEWAASTSDLAILVARRGGRSRCSPRWAPSPRGWDVAARAVSRRRRARPVLLEARARG